MNTTLTNNPNEKILLRHREKQRKQIYPLSSANDRESKGLTSSFYDPSTIIATSILTASVLGGFYIYKMYLRRIAESRKLPLSFMRHRTMLGYVTSVGDGDNFHFYHTPGGILAGWYWLRPVPKVNQRGLGKQTLHVRLCGVDAPERSHFGKPAQKWGDEALAWLRSYVLGRRVRVKPLSIDQYNRVVGKVTILKWNGRRDISAEMIRQGWGVVYEGKKTAEFDGNEHKYRRLEVKAKKKKLGIWQQGVKKVVTPGTYKRKYNNL